MKLRSLETRLVDDEPFDVLNEPFDVLNKARQFKRGFDVIICDLEMPNVDGIEFVRRLRSDENVANSEVPVLILTEGSDEENVLKSVNVGIHGFLAKPASQSNT